MANKLYSYVITIDNGKSPCYDNDIYTLACCKPQIRRMMYKSADRINSGEDNIWIMGIQRDRGNDNIPFII